MKLLSKILILGVFCSLMFSSCDESRVFEEHEDMKLFRWHLDNVVSYDVKIDDLSEKNILLGVRHNYFFEYRNIICKVNVTTPEGTVIETPVDVLLAEPSGLWYGECSGDICDVMYLIPEFTAYSFSDTGTYHFEIMHDMRQDPLLNVMSIGLRVENVIVE